MATAPHGHPVVDLYIPDCLDIGRLLEDLEFIAGLVQDWDGTLSARQAEMMAVRPVFQRLQTVLPCQDMEYTVGHYHPHFVEAFWDRIGERLIFRFDLWPAMRERDI